ncbi:phage integrase SAM-like domain-containing protein, partial [Prevotella sp.]|uniref:phage integrase SAM-like domain-containing protein n=1 Tax=Prevotella sp. TaxID=59823 RepID=UPI004027698E
MRYESLGIYIYVKPKNQMEQKYSKWQHVYMHFRTFTQGKCTFGEINVDLCN